MKYVDEFRDRRRAEGLLDELRRVATRKWVVMEVCGGQTHSILRYGLDALLPETIEIVHGPGCPVCVTPLELIDRAHAVASQKDVVFTSFGDMLRVPGSRGTLLSARAAGADVRVVYSPLDALRIARENPTRKIVFFAIGFETTAPANAVAVATAKAQGIRNFSVLAAHVRISPAMAAILQSKDNRVNAYLGAGHVVTVVGCREYEALSERYRVPIVVTGFEPTDILAGTLLAVRQLEEGRAVVENEYARVVRHAGNRVAQQIVDDVFEVTDRKWRGIGTIPKSGLKVRYEYRDHDAERLFEVDDIETAEPAQCISGLVLKGQKRPSDCPAFGTACTPEHPLGATMVSDEGACAAYHRYRRRKEGAVELPTVP